MLRPIAGGGFQTLAAALSAGYEKLGAVDQGAIVDNKRLGHVLQISQLVQAKRDDRVVNVPSTAHRYDGTAVPRNKLAGSKRQRELGPEDLESAVQSKASIAQMRRVLCFRVRGISLHR